VSDHYDVLIVGAGLSGLICANYLARAGKRVLLLEQNHQPGGNMSGFRRRGFYFDAGDQSFESLGIVFPILR
jgi:phytoene dehydrogenase-like protein